MECSWRGPLIVGTCVPGVFPPLPRLPLLLLPPVLLLLLLLLRLLLLTRATTTTTTYQCYYYYYYYFFFYYYSLPVLLLPGCPSHVAGQAVRGVGGVAFPTGAAAKVAGEGHRSPARGRLPAAAGKTATCSIENPGSKRSRAPAHGGHHRPQHDRHDHSLLLSSSE